MLTTKYLNPTMHVECLIFIKKIISKYVVHALSVHCKLRNNQVAVGGVARDSYGKWLWDSRKSPERLMLCGRAS